MVEAAYVFADDHYGFKIGKHKPDFKVVIDPLLASTFIGCANPDPPGNYDDDIIYSMVSVGDYLYLAGVTQSPNFPIELGAE
ncbi:MAG: hypothetical protein ACMUJM_21985 [bacterium]